MDRPVIRFVKVRLKGGIQKGYSGPSVRLKLDPDLLIVYTAVGQEAFARDMVESYEEREI